MAKRTDSKAEEKGLPVMQGGGEARPYVIVVEVDADPEQAFDAISDAAFALSESAQIVGGYEGTIAIHATAKDKPGTYCDGVRDGLDAGIGIAEKIMGLREDWPVVPEGVERR